MIKLKNFEIGSNKLTILAGPCAVETLDIMRETAEGLKKVCEKLGINYVFKCSYDKANRSSINSYRGLGMEKGLEYLAKIKKEFDLPIVTDIHTPDQAPVAAEVADIIQIPAFLCRQTDLLVAAAKTQKTINVKKGQFLAPWDMKNIILKVEDSGNHNILLTERGTSFGYNALVVDMTSIVEMKKFGYPVVFDATHSVQKPGGNGVSTGGNRNYVEPLAKAAVAAGADALFFETHPNPDKALSDGPNMVPLDQFEKMLKSILCVMNASRKME